MGVKALDLDLIDLISETHIQVRRKTDKAWNDNNEIRLSSSEWFILARISQKQQTTISCVSKSVDISRQATHKFIKNLEEKGLVLICDLENNKKEKGLKLTKLGEDYLVKKARIKADIENDIAEKIGNEHVQLMKEILRLDWGIINTKAVDY